MTTFGYVDHAHSTVYTVEAVSAKEALAKFKDSGFDVTSIYHVRTAPMFDSATGKSHFAEAARLARAGREK